MLGKLTDWIVGREPVATATGLAGGVAALVGVLHAFDVLRLSAEQTAAIGALVAWVAGYLARRVVTPVAKLTTLPAERGGVVIAATVAVVGLLVVFFLVADACLEDESERNDLGMARTEDNQPCEGDNACQGRQKKGCAEASAPCSDDDKVTVIVCTPESNCSFGGREGT